MTDIHILKELNLKLGDEITLLDLDERVEEFINDEEIDTPLESFAADEIVEWGVYPFYTAYENDNGLPTYKIHFKVINNTGDENTIIKIVR